MYLTQTPTRPTILRSNHNNTHPQYRLWRKANTHAFLLRAVSQMKRPRRKSGIRNEMDLYKLKGVSFGGAGIFFWWELGCVLWLLENVDVDNCPLFGASGGALAATLTACKVDPFRAFEVANRLATEKGVFNRRFGVAGIWGDIIRQWLHELLPPDAADICSGRVQLIVTTLPLFQLKAISDFESKEKLIEANLASCHIPFFLDGKFSCNFKDLVCIDGSLHDFFSGYNSDLLTCNGSHLNFDYFHDPRLKSKRLDFVSLKTPSEVMKMIYLGYGYTENLSKTEAFQNALVNGNTTSYHQLQESNIVFNV